MNGLIVFTLLLTLASFLSIAGTYIRSVLIYKTAKVKRG